MRTASAIITARLAFLLVFAPVARGQNSRPVGPGDRLALSNDFVRIEFEPEGMGVSAMIDRHGGFNHVQPVAGKHLLWEVAMARGTQIVRVNNNTASCNHAHIDELPGGGSRAVMEWNDLPFWKENKALSIRAIVELPADSGVAHWRISVANSSDYWGVWTVTYPLVNGFPAAGKYDIARPKQSSGGELLKGWSQRIEEHYPSGYWPMQFASLNQGRNAVYFAGMDPDARSKDFVIAPGDRLAMVHYAENMGVPGSGYPDYYPVALGVYQGGWLDAAQRYRGWALRQKWAQGGKLSQRTDVPEIVANAGVWLREGWAFNTPAGSPHEMNAPLIKLQDELGVPIALHWYDWEQAPFDHLYPHFLPAKQGFRERVAELVRSGILVMPYINAMSADMDIPDWGHFAPAAIMDQAGGLHMWNYSDRSGRLLSMCPTQRVWQSAIVKTVDDLVAGEGVNGVYLDQISAMPNELCFNAQHGHPLGGGRHWADGYRELLRQVRNGSQRNGRRTVLTSEGVNEVFFDLLDANLEYAQPNDREIPMLEVVYSGYTLFFASPCDYRKSDRYFSFAEGRPFLDGRQIGWMNTSLFAPEHAAKAAFFKECARYRVAARKFLTYGRLLEPLEPLNDIPAFTDEFTSFTNLASTGAWEEIHPGAAPIAEGRLWQSEDGHLGVFLANYEDHETPFGYRIDPAKYGLKAGRFRLAEITPQGSVAMGTAIGPIERTERLGPRQIKVLEIAPAPAP
jgi:hypothetical protein